MHRLGLSL